MTASPTVDNKRLDEWVEKEQMDFSKVKKPEDQKEKKKEGGGKKRKKKKKKNDEGDDDGECNTAGSGGRTLTLSRPLLSFESGLRIESELRSFIWPYR